MRNSGRPRERDVRIEECRKAVVKGRKPWGGGEGVRRGKRKGKNGPTVKLFSLCGGRAMAGRLQLDNSASTPRHGATESSKHVNMPLTNGKLGKTRKGKIENERVSYRRVVGGGGVTKELGRRRFGGRLWRGMLWRPQPSSTSPPHWARPSLAS